MLIPAIGATRKAALSVQIGPSTAVYFNYHRAEPLVIGRDANVAVVVDCADEVPSYALQPLEEYFGRPIQTIMAGNPYKRSGLLWQAFRWNRITMSSRDVARLSPEFAAELEARCGPKAVRWLVDGEFPES